MISNLTWQLFKSALKQYQGAIIGGLIAVLCGGAIGWFVHERITQSEIHSLNVELRKQEKVISGYEQEKREAAERHVATLQAALSKFNAEQQRTQDLEKIYTIPNCNSPKPNNSSRSVLMKPLNVMVILIALVITACNSTPKPLVTECVIASEVKPSPETYRAKAMPVKPKNGSTTEILHHATAYGAWCTGMKNQLDMLTQWLEEKP